VFSDSHFDTKMIIRTNPYTNNLLFCVQEARSNKTFDLKHVFGTLLAIALGSSFMY
jgi:hypothetical protein